MNSEFAVPFLRAGKRIEYLQPRKPAEVAVAGDDLGNAMFQAQGDDVSVVDQIARGARLAKDLVEHGSVPCGFGEEKERR